MLGGKGGGIRAREGAMTDNAQDVVKISSREKMMVDATTGQVVQVLIGAVLFVYQPNWD